MNSKYISILLGLIFCQFLVGIEVLDISYTDFNNQLPLENYIRVVPADSLSDPMNTETWITCDSKYLYIRSRGGIDSTFSIGAYSTDESIVDADYLRYQIITDPKNHYSYVFYVFPLKNKLDSIRNPDFSYNNNWNNV